MDATITFSLTTTSCQHKVNKSYTSVVCLDNKVCCNDAAMYAAMDVAITFH